MLVDGETRELVRYTALQASLLEERNWRLAVLGVEEIGIRPTVVASLIGVDPAAEWELAAGRVDAVAAEIDDPQLFVSLENVRVQDETDLRELGGRYEELGVDLSERSDQLFDELRAVAGDLPNGAALLRTARVLEAAAATRTSTAIQLSSYFSARFSGPDTARDEATVLVQQQVVYDGAIKQINRSVRPNSNVAAQMLVVEQSAEIARFEEGVAQLIVDIQASAAVGTAEGFANIAGDLDGVARQFEAGKVSSGVHLDLVTAAGTDVIVSSQMLTSRANDATRQATATIAVLSVLSVAFAIALTRFIGQPLYRLSETASLLRDGVHRDNEVFSGPSEIREAASALNEASSHLRLAERQANALARGDLDAAVLAETARGDLGVSLQAAVQTLAASLAEREEFRRRLAHEASHDGLTHLPNRKACLAQLEAGLVRTDQRRSTLAVIFIDLDGFKIVNDQFGHPAGDLVLETTSARLLAGVREGDHVGRLGGDEFVVIAEPVASLDEAERLAARLLEAIGEPISLGKATVRVGASIGIAMADESHAEADALLRDADLAVYRAKSNGRNQVVVCDEELRSLVVHQNELEVELRLAIENDELTLFYQPIVDPNSGALVGLEALIRWFRPDGTLVSPDAFIPFAERSDLIVEIDCWVVARVARQLDAWRRGGAGALLPVSINISGRHLSVDDFVVDVMSPLEQYGVDPTLIIIEVTERALLDDLGGAATKLQTLRDNGVRIAIDDFGTGYTSLAHLRTLPIDILKLDQSFTRDDSTQSLVKLIIDTGHLLGVSITSEGIETADQARALSELGSDDLQGYYYGRPSPPEDVVFGANELADEVSS